MGSLLVLFQGTVSAAEAEGIFVCLEADVGGCDEGESTEENPQRWGGSQRERAALDTRPAL